MSTRTRGGAEPLDALGPVGLVLLGVRVGEHLGTHAGHRAGHTAGWDLGYAAGFRAGWSASDARWGEHWHESRVQAVASVLSTPSFADLADLRGDHQTAARQRELLRERGVA